MALAGSCNVSRACAAARISRSVVYGAKQADPDFAARWQEALDDACDALELEARRRALQDSDQLLMFLLRAQRPQIYRERFELGGPGTPPKGTHAHDAPSAGMGVIALPSNDRGDRAPAGGVN